MPYRYYLKQTQTDMQLKDNFSGAVIATLLPQDGVDAVMNLIGQLENDIATERAQVEAMTALIKVPLDMLGTTWTENYDSYNQWRKQVRALIGGEPIEGTPEYYGAIKQTGARE